MIRKSRNNEIPPVPEQSGEQLDFDEMMSKAKDEIQERDAEDAIISRVPQLKQLSSNIDKAIEDAPTKLKETITLCDADWQKIQDLLRKQREWLINQAQTTVQSVNAMLVEEHKKTVNR